MNIRGSEWVVCDIIGASLSEPHTSKLNGAIFIYIYIYIIIYLSYVFRMSFRLQFNATSRRMRSTSNIFATFQNEQSIHSFPMVEDGEKRQLGGVAGMLTFTVRELQVVKTPLATLQNADGG